MPEPRSALFPALLKHWRGQRGLSQLDLALAADVSARHISFLETGRSSPSAEMVLRLSTTLGVPLRHTNAMLQAAGHEAVYPTDEGPLPPSVQQALDLLKSHHEPFPIIVIDRAYQVRDLNRGALAMMGAVLGVPVPPRGLTADEIAALDINLARLTFDPAGAHPYVANFEAVGRELLWRLQREVLADPDDGRIRGLLDALLAMPTVSDDWRQIDLSVRSEPVISIHLKRGDLEMTFITMITAFQAPQNVSVEELRVETWFPGDAKTAEVCRALASS